MKHTIFVIDAYNLIYRMFYAIPEMHTRGGMQVNAIFGVAKFLKTLSLDNPNATVVVARDVWTSFRSELNVDYKGTRERMPDNLRSQIDGVFSLFDAANIPVIGREWYEADDVMGSMAVSLSDKERQVVIISSDKDLCQFVQDDCVHIYDAMKRKFMREADVLEKFWVPTDQVRDYLAIVGDAADNILWIAGIGPKKAKDMIEKYGSLEGIYEHIADFTPKMQIVLENGRESAFLSQKLATIITDLHIDIPLDTDFRDKILSDNYQNILKEYEFRSLIEGDNLQKETKITIVTHTINTLSECENLMNSIREKNTRVGISIDMYQKIFVSFLWEVYILDSKKIDVSDFVRAIVSGKILIAVYDAKELLTNLFKILHPEGESMTQNSLF